MKMEHGLDQGIQPFMVPHICEPTSPIRDYKHLLDLYPIRSAYLDQEWELMTGLTW